MIGFTFQKKQNDIILQHNKIQIQIQTINLYLIIKRKH